MLIAPRGSSYSRWGGHNGNHSTVGIAYTLPYWKEDENGQPEWKTAWVRPQTIHYDWVTYSDIVNANNRRQEQYRAQQDIEKSAREVRIQALPAGVISALDLYDSQREDLANRGSFISYRLSLEKLEAIVRAVRASSPEQIQKEVEAALALL